MTEETFHQYDFISYLFEPDIIKFGVLADEEIEGDVIRVYCLHKTQDGDGLWMFKPGHPIIDLDRVMVVSNMTRQVKTLGQQFLLKGDLKKVKFIVPEALVKVLKDTKPQILEEVAERKRNRTQAANQNAKAPKKPTNVKEAKRGKAAREEIEEEEEAEAQAAPLIETSNRKKRNLKRQEEQEEMMEEPMRAETSNQKDLGPRAETMEEKGVHSAAKESAQAQEEEEQRDNEELLDKRPPKLTKTQKKALQKENRIQRLAAKDREERDQRLSRLAKTQTSLINFKEQRLDSRMLNEELLRNSSVESFEEEKIPVKNQLIIQSTNSFIESLNLNDAKLLHVLVKVSGLMPSKGELKKTIDNLSRVEEQIRGSEEEGGIRWSTAALWMAVYKFLSALESKNLFALKKYLVCSVAAAATETSIPYFGHLKTVYNLVKRLKPFMDQFNQEQIGDIYSELLGYLVDQNHESQSVRELFREIYLEMVDSYLQHDSVGRMIEKVNHRLFARVDMEKNEINMVAWMKQTNFYVKLLIEIFDEEEIPISTKYWRIVIDSYAKYLKTHRGKIVQKLSNDQALLKSQVVEKIVALSTTVTLRKAYYLALIKVCIGEHITAQSAGAEDKKALNKFLDSLLNDEKTFPFFVFFVQSLNEHVGDFKTMEEKGLTSIDRFIHRYVKMNDEELLGELKIKGGAYEADLEAVGDQISLMKGGKLADGTLNEVIRMINSPQTIEAKSKALPKSIQKELRYNLMDDCDPEPLETYLFWVHLINECLLQYILNDQSEYLTQMRLLIANNRDKLRESLIEEDYAFLVALVTNFEEMPILSLNPSLNEGEMRLRVAMAHLFAQLILLRQPEDFLGLSSTGKKVLAKRDQLCAYPSPEEERFRIIAQLVYEKVMNQWRSSSDVTSLNQCSCGYYYFIGNCGKPYEAARCPECKKFIGGESHEFKDKTNKVITNDQFLIDYGKLEKIGGKHYFQRDLEHIDDGMSVRMIRGSLNFKLVEMVSHARYMFELLVAGAAEKKALLKFLNLSEGTEPLVYLLELIKIDLKSLNQTLKSNVKSYHWLNIFIRNLRLTEEQLKQNKKMKRNSYEKLLSDKIDSYLQAADARIKLYAKSQKLKKEVTFCKRLVSDWISNLVTVEDFVKRGLSVDLRVITAFKMGGSGDSQTSTQEKLQRYLALSCAEPGQVPLLKYCLAHQKLLRAFQTVFFHHLDLSNHLMDRLECKVTLKEACTLNMADLWVLRSNMLLDERLEDIIEQNGGDTELKYKFDAFFDAWHELTALREEFPDILDLRFMCHGESLSADKLKELLNPATSKVAYFLVNEKNVESLFINSIFQTLCKYQNLLLTKFSSYFVKVNGNKPITTPMQDIQLELIVSFPDDFDALIARNENIAPSEGYSMEVLERQLAEQMFLGKAQLDFEGAAIKNFSYHLDFNTTYAKIQEIQMCVPQEELSDNQTHYIGTLIHLNAAHIFSQFQRAVKNLNSPKYYKVGGNFLKFDNDVEGLNQMSVKMSQLKDFYQRLELALFKKAVRHLDVLFQIPIDGALQSGLKELSTRFKEEMGVLTTALRRLLLRQLIGSTSEKMANESLMSILEYSDVFEENVELSPQLLEAISPKITLGQVLATINCLLY